LGTEEKRGTTFRSSTDEIFEKLTWNNKITYRKVSMYWAKNGSTEHSKGNKTLVGLLATTCTEDGHKQTTKTSTTISAKRTKEHRTTEEEMEGPTAS